MLKIEKGISDKGNKVNEDIMGYNNNSAWLLDGSTGVRGVRITNYDSDAEWFVRKWDEYLKTSLLEDRNLKCILREGIDKIKKQYFEFKGASELEFIDYPSATITIVREVGGYLEYFVLGDSPLIYKINGNICIVEDNKVNMLDNIVSEKIMTISKELGINYLEAKEKGHEFIIENRYLKNNKEGYWILEFEKSAIDNAVYNRILIENKIEFVIISDGISRYYDTLNLVKDYNEFFTYVDNNNINIILNNLRKREKSDLLCNEYPRFKVSDDATIIAGTIII